MPDPKGLGLHEVKLCPPDPAWSAIAKRESSRLARVSGVTAVEHIGSTAIPGIMAKPVVDIAVSVSGDPADQRLKSGFEAFGYVAHGEYGLTGRQFFTLGNPPSVHLHVVNLESRHWRDWMDFRNYLRDNPVEAKEYEKEKLRLVGLFSKDRPAYTKSKTVFVKGVLAKARGHRAG